MLIAGTLSALTLLISLLALTLLFMWYAKKGKSIYLRKIPGLDAIDEAVGRATEMARPVHFSTGTSGTLYSEEAPQILAGLTVLSHVARLTARHRTPLISTVCDPSSYIITQETVKESYLKEGRLDDFRPDMVRYISQEQQAYVAGVQGIFMRERVAANFMIGPLYAETLMIAETGYRVGAIQIGGTGTKTIQMPFLVAVCDYTLIGEEIYAAGAYISRAPAMLATILAGDIAKFGILILFAIGTIVTLFSQVFRNLLRM